MSEMLGVFHAQSDVELSELSSFSSSPENKNEPDDDHHHHDHDHDDRRRPKSRMEEALEDISVKDPEGLLWEQIKKNLSSIE